MMCHLQFLAMMATTVPPPAVAETAADGEAMVVDMMVEEAMVVYMMAETETAAGAYSNQPKSKSKCGRNSG
jgi:hypothetical protein